MRKLLFVLLCVVALSGLALAQPGTYVPSQDVLGAHNNGGRGCAGCHQPHSGAGGSGGNAITGKTSDTTHSGDDALFGQDLGPIYGLQLAMGDGGSFVETIPSSFAVGDEELRGIGMCLACHDGSVAKGAMMVGNSYEQRMGMLPAGVYGSGAIPTLLGADGHGTGYNNDHPVGVNATLGAAHLISSYGPTANLTVDLTGGKINSIKPTSGSQYADFVADYGMPAIAGTAWGWGVANPSGNTDATKLYITCTTCHNQHVMNVYKGVGKGAKGGYTSASDSGTYKTYFFINGPYNIDNLNQGGSTLTNQAASATQFCRQCHFSVANESFGLKLSTAF